MTVGGVTACKTQEDYELIKFYQNMHGNIMSPMVAFLTLQVCHVKGRIVRQQMQSPRCNPDVCSITCASLADLLSA
jgi:hypothetical protein